MTPDLITYNKHRLQLPDEQALCSWNFCKDCIDYRIRHRMVIPKLKSHPDYKVYFRYKNPEHRIERKHYPSL